MSGKIYLVRHCEKAWKNGRKANDQDGCDHDPPMLGRGKLDETIAKFKENNVKFDAIISSPFLRCRQTLGIILDETKDECKNISMCKEVGEYLGNQRRGLPHINVDTAKSYTQTEFKNLTTETIKRMKIRVKRFREQMVPKEGNTLIITHGIIIKELTGKDLEEGALLEVDSFIQP